MVLVTALAEVPQLSFRWPDGPEHSACCPNNGIPAKSSGKLQLPSLIGIGVEKCGSTYLADLLRLHPEFQIAMVKEIHFFDHALAPSLLPSIFEKYLTMWPANNGMAKAKRGLREYGPRDVGFGNYDQEDFDQGDYDQEDPDQDDRGHGYDEKDDYSQEYYDQEETDQQDYAGEDYGQHVLNVPAAHRQSLLHLYEVTPNYIYIPSAACRIKALVPNAKLVVILRDPADRAYSQFTMFRSVCSPRDANRSYICPYRSQRFFDVVQEGIALLGIRKCTFNTGKPVRSWNDCFGCLINDEHVRTYCQGRWYLFNDGPSNQRCHDFASDMVSRGLYAAQIAWWFQQFPPEQFLFINADDLFEDPVEELNRVADFVGLNMPFTSRMLTKHRKGKVHMNLGRYNEFNDTLVEEAKAILRDFYRESNEDLYELLRLNGHDFRRFSETGSSANSSGLEDVVDVMM